MQRDLDKLRRQPFLFPLVVPVLVFIGVVPPRPGSSMRARPPSSSSSGMRRRKPAADPDPELSVDGRERAARLAKMLSKAQPVRGVDAIFASEFRRTHQTVTPLSETLALPVNRRAFRDLGRSAAARSRVSIAANTCWSLALPTTVPQLVEELSGEKVTLREDEYDAMFIVFVPQISKTKVVRVRY